MNHTGIIILAKSDICLLSNFYNDASRSQDGLVGTQRLQSLGRIVCQGLLKFILFTQPLSSSACKSTWNPSRIQSDPGTHLTLIQESALQQQLDSGVKYWLGIPNSKVTPQFSTYLTILVHAL